MRIGIDGRLINETGVGRYVRNLIRELVVQDATNEYVVFLRATSYDAFTLPNARWTKVCADVPWHTITEQVIMPWLFLKARLDLVHIPYFNIPIFYPGRMVATIHDLTILHFDTGKATTLPYVFYKLRRFGYRIALEVGLRRATKIIAVSQATKNELIDHFHLDPGEIVVTYEGVDQKLYAPVNQKPLIKKPYVLYVGNAYPHKNLETLLRAFQQHMEKLILVGKEDFFYRKIKELVHSLALDDRVVFFGEADDEQLANLYSFAKTLVFPSLMEGFGLPGLEAMALSTPVVCSDIPVFHEIYQNAALYFNPENPKDITKKLNSILSDNKLRNRLIEKGKNRIHAYSWRTMAEKTLAVYQKQNEI